MNREMRYMCNINQKRYQIQLQSQMSIRKSNVFIYPIDKVIFPYNEFTFQINPNFYEPDAYDNLIGFVTKVSGIEDSEARSIEKVSGMSCYGSLLKINKTDTNSYRYNDNPPKQKKINVSGLVFARFKILQLKQVQAAHIATLEIFNDQVAPEIQTFIDKNDLIAKLKKQIKVYYAYKLKYQEAQTKIQQVDEETNINRVIYKSCSEVDLPIHQKLKILQTKRHDNKIELLLEFLLCKTDKNKQVLELEKNVRKVIVESQAKKSLLYRMSDVDEIHRKLKSKKFPEHVREEIEVQVKRLGVGAQSTVNLKYIQTLLEIPWLDCTPEIKDLAAAERILNEDHTGLSEVKERILQFLAVRFRNGNTKGNVICLHGPPGVGKTSISKSIAKALGKQFTRISLGGLSDEAQLRGHRRTYLGSLPGVIIKALIKAKSNNPVILLDEIEKMGTNSRGGGSPQHALLEILDPSQNSSFKDNYVSLPVDLSKVMFICTANSLDLSAPLLNRLELIEIPGYTNQQKLEIMKNHLLPHQLKQNGVQDLISFEINALQELIKHSKQMGVRQLQRNLAKICRKAARLNQKQVITPQAIVKILGPVKTQERWSGVGVVNGMAWTEMGGKILLVQAVKYVNSKSVLEVTGQLGSVMKQSINIALSWIRANRNDFALWSEGHPNILEQIDELEKISLHLHFPAGGIKKDGPSAGITIVACLVSLLLKVPVKESLSMTGEITLSGQVLPVGGVWQKCVAAISQGIKNIIIPIGNIKDLQKIPIEMKKDVNFYPVRTIKQVLAVSFPSLLDKITPKI